MKKFSFILFSCLIFFSINPLFAKSPFKAVGIGGGVNLSQGGWVPGITVNLRTDLGEVVKYLYFTPYINYSHATKLYTENDDSENLTIGYVTLGTKFYGYLNSRPRGFYFGGGLSYNMISYKHVIQNDNPVLETRTINTSKIGFSGLAGFQYPIKKITLFIETEYMFAQGNLSQFLGMIGGSYNF